MTTPHQADQELQHRLALQESRLSFLESRLAHLETRLGPASDVPQAPDPPRPIPHPDWVPVFHKACRRAAFYLTRRFSPDERGQVEAMRICPGADPTWRQPDPGEASSCSACGQAVDPVTDKDLDWRDAVAPPNRPNPGMPPVTPSPADPTGRLSVLGDLFALAKAAGLDPATLPPPPPPPRS